MKTLIICALTLVCFAANAQVGKIDDICIEYDSKIKQAEEEEADWMVPNITIKNTLNKRAIGPVDHDITIYFDESEEMAVDENTGNEFPVNNAIIRKAIFKMTSVSYTIEYTFYFDQEGKLIQYGEKEETAESCLNTFIYFENRKPINIIKSTVNGEPCSEDAEAEFYESNELNNDEHQLAKMATDQAVYFEMILRLNYELIQD